jgi:hypothetical protein
VVLKIVTSRSSGKVTSPSGAAAPISKSAKRLDQLSVIAGAVIIKCYSTAAFVDESRYNAPLRAQSAKIVKCQDNEASDGRQ